jgi:hypothetical protein
VGPAGERDMAVACWWRAAAAQALSGYVLGVMGKGLAAQPAQQVGALCSSRGLGGSGFGQGGEDMKGGSGGDGQGPGRNRWLQSMLAGCCGWGGEERSEVMRDGFGCEHHTADGFCGLD